MRALLICLLAFILPHGALAEKRVGLIIGNDAYADVPALAKAVADARAVSEALQGVGFETVLAVDASRREMNRRIAEFTGMLSPGDTAFVFYAGHGVEISGENYLLPTDIVSPDSGDQDFVAGESIALSDLLDRVRKTGARTTIAVIDACRNNPFEAATGRSIGRTRGLGRIAAPEGTFVMYSAGAGQLALDGLNEADPAQNSVFTRLLLPKISQPGLELRTLISELRVEVRDLARTQNHAQFPAYYDELLGDFYFKSGRGLEPVTPIADAGGDAADAIRADFTLASEIGTPEALRAFIDRYDGTGHFTVTAARAMVGALDAEAAAPRVIDEDQMAALTPEENPTPAEPRATRRDIIRQSQQELARLGCRPGGADGVLGPRSRAAFGRFVTQTGSGLSQDALGTQKALDVLAATAAPACKAVEMAVREPDPVAPQAAGGIDLSGSWRYSAFCIVVPVTGSSVVTRTGDNTFVGTFQDSLGQKGNFYITLNGRNYSNTIVVSNGTRAAESGVYAADGRSFKSTSHSGGCAVTGTKVG